MSHTPRRTFLIAASAIGTAALSTRAVAQAPMVDPASPQAVALGYYADTKKVDTKKWPKHQATQLCSNCALYQGKPTDKAAACPLFPAKQVAGPGWCSAWAKKP
jgi:hypothetical protein